MKSWRWHLLIAFTLELLSVAVLFSHWDSWVQVLLYFILHAAATPGMARVMWHQLPRRYRVPARNSLFFLQVMVFCLPFVGVAGLLWGLMLALRWPRLRRTLSLRGLSVPALPFQLTAVRLPLPYSQGALPQILRFSALPLRRVKALMATRQMPVVQALPIWSVALRDRSDDVRLLAYAMRDSAEKQLMDHIQRLQTELPDLQGEKAVMTQQWLAFWCAELVLSGLVQGDVKKHWLREALRWLDVPKMHPEMMLLKARLYLQMPEVEAAESALTAAQSAGLPLADLASWRAECAFLRRDFDAVRFYLKQDTRQRWRGSAYASVWSSWCRIPAAETAISDQGSVHVAH